MLDFHDLPYYLCRFQGYIGDVANSSNILKKDGHQHLSLRGHFRSLETDKKSMSSLLIGFPHFTYVGIYLIMIPFLSLTALQMGQIFKSVAHSCLIYKNV